MGETPKSVGFTGRSMKNLTKPPSDISPRSESLRTTKGEVRAPSLAEMQAAVRAAAEQGKMGHSWGSLGNEHAATADRGGGSRNDRRHTFGVVDGLAFGSSYKGQLAYNADAGHVWGNRDISGVGMMTNAKWTYWGQFSEGNFHGYGKLRYKNGDYWMGNFVNDQVHGLALEFRSGWNDDRSGPSGNGASWYAAGMNRTPQKRLLETKQNSFSNKTGPDSQVCSKTGTAKRF
jgi:hypothetical protein